VVLETPPQFKGYKIIIKLYEMKRGRKFGFKHSEETKKSIGKSTSISLRGKKKSVEHRRKIGLSQTGKRSHNWQGGISKINWLIRGSREYRIWRKSVFERDDYTCIWCGKKEKLEVDHIKPFAYYPELRFAIDNGRTLCKDCHKKTSTWGYKTINNK
jgi:hypothetical protein